jgi:hypothetical protein
VVVGGRRLSRRGRRNSDSRGSGNADANSDRARTEPCGSAGTSGSASTGSARTGASPRTGSSPGAAACRACAGASLSLSEHLQRNRKRYHQQECNTDRIFSEFPHNQIPPFIKDVNAT